MTYAATTETLIGAVIPITTTLWPAGSADSCSPSGDLTNTMQATPLRFLIKTLCHISLYHQHPQKSLGKPTAVTAPSPELPDSTEHRYPSSPDRSRG